MYQMMYLYCAIHIPLSSPLWITAASYEELSTGRAPPAVDRPPACGLIASLSPSFRTCIPVEASFGLTVLLFPTVDKFVSLVSSSRVRLCVISATPGYQSLFQHPLARRNKTAPSTDPPPPPTIPSRSARRVSTASDQCAFRDAVCGSFTPLLVAAHLSDTRAAP